MANGTSYRRGSVFGALLLIAVGGLFLYANMHPEFNAWQVLARYWPALIIFWGLSKLADYLVLRGRPEAVAATRLTGGDIVGLLFLLLIGWCFSEIVQRGWWRDGVVRIGDEELGCLFGNEYEFSDELVQSLDSPTAFSLNHPRGDVTLTAGTGDEFRLVARKTVCAGSESDARRLADQFEPILEGGPERYELRWETPPEARALVRLDADLQIPQAANLEISGRRGDVRVSGFGGEVNLTVERGDTTVENVAGDVRIKLRHRGDLQVTNVGGSIEVEGRGGEVRLQNIARGARLEGSFYGPIEFASIAGPVAFSSSRTDFTAERLDGELRFESGEVILRDAPGDVTLHTRNYEITVENVAGQLRIENRNGDVEVRSQKPPTRPIEVQTRSGSIELVLPASSSFVITANARNGEIESDFSGLTPEERRGNWSLQGSYGRGGPAIQLSTTHDIIYLRRTGG